MSRAKIAAANDAFRTTLKGGKVLWSPEVRELDPQTRGRLLNAITQYSAFDKDGYHDAGVLIFCDFCVEWHIEKRPDGFVLLIDITGDLQRAV
jgi:hypothetical protein